MERVRRRSRNESACKRLSAVVRMNRKWLAVDWVEDYIEGSKFRFG